MSFVNYLDYVIAILKIVGFAFVFVKCGVKWWYCLIPYANTYKLCQCADKEEDGFVWGFTDFFSVLVRIGLSTDSVSYDNNLQYLLDVIYVILLIVNLIYMIRVFSSFCKVFNISRKWIWLLVLVEGLALIIIGASKKIQPCRKVNMQDDDSRGSLSDAEVLEKGLTVNIKARTTKIHFKKVNLLKDVRLNITPGKMVLLLGGSGAGKTTFLNAITGYEKADAVITINGRNVYDEFEKVKYEIGFVPQQELLRGTDTVHNTLQDAAKLRLPKEITKKEKSEKIDKVMDLFGLTKVKDSLISKLSGGQKKRISIATEYISDPAVFILDEPDSGLDGILARELMSGLHDISREGKIVIVVTHTPDRAIDLFDEVIVLAKDSDRTGRLVFKGPVDEAKEFFSVDSMEGIVKSINLPDEGGDGRADELIRKYVEVQNGTV